MPSAPGVDPWLRSWPVLLADVVPSVVDNRWYLVESDDTALSIAPSFRPRRLLGVAGSRGHRRARGVPPRRRWTVAQ
ncbi:hypothetical protein [Nocardia callitridis]|uniref:hypothetical protein n=1 Tax=Nocardia callitridis TaxID=648753 RepID=UPI0031E5F90B